MIDGRQDPLASALRGLPRVTPDVARAARVQAQCARLYASRTVKQPPRSRVRATAIAVATVAVIYLAELSRSVYRLIG